MRKTGLVRQFSSNVPVQNLERFGWFMVFNATFNNISAISWRSVLVVEEAGVPGENHFITCGCESSAPFFVIYKAWREPTPYW